MTKLSINKFKWIFVAIVWLCCVIYTFGIATDFALSEWPLTMNNNPKNARIFAGTESLLAPISTAILWVFNGHLKWCVKECAR